jgi:ketosteroid isomerase-like protein
MDDAATIARSAMDWLDEALSGKPDAIEQRLEPDVVFIGSGDGEEAVGVDAFRAMLEPLRNLVGDGTFGIDWDSFKSERAGDIILVSAFGQARATGSMARFDGTRYRMTGVLVKRDGVWRWKAYHGSEPGSWD